MKNILKIGTIVLALGCLFSAGCTTTQPSTGFERIETDNLYSVMYFESTETLSVISRDGVGYNYFKVPAATYQELLNAEDKEAFYNDNIKGKFESEKF